MNERAARGAYDRSRGFTLLEVLVAMTLLAIGITSVLSAVSACVRSNDAAAGYSRAALRAQQVAAELERAPSLDAETMDGTFDDTAGYAWTATISGANDAGLYPAHITVTWQSGSRTFVMETLLRPHPLPEAAPPTPAGEEPTPPTPPDAGGRP